MKNETTDILNSWVLVPLPNLLTGKTDMHLLHVYLLE